MSIKQEGIQHLLELMNGAQTKPANYYIGWSTDIETAIPANATLADLAELTGNGYARQAVASNATDLVSAAGGTNGRTLTTKTVTFTADGGAWSLAKTMFLASSLDDSGKLIATEALNSGSGVALADTQSHDCAMILASQP